MFYLRTLPPIFDAKFDVLAIYPVIAVKILSILDVEGSIAPSLKYKLEMPVNF
jgi:hypothetical protein